MNNLEKNAELRKIGELSGRVTVAGGVSLTVEEETDALSITPKQCEPANEFIKRMETKESEDNTDKGK